MKMIMNIDEKFLSINEQLNNKIKELKTDAHFAECYGDTDGYEKAMIRLERYRSAKEAHINAYFKDPSTNMYILFRYIKNLAICKHDEKLAAVCQIIIDLYKDN